MDWKFVLGAAPSELTTGPNRLFIGSFEYGIEERDPVYEIDLLTRPKQARLNTRKSQLLDILQREELKSLK